MRELWKELFDTFELPSEDIVMDVKQVATAQAKAAQDTDKIKQKYFAQPAGQQVTPNINQNIQDQVGNEVEQVVELMGTDRELPPESELLKEAFQY